MDVSGGGGSRTRATPEPRCDLDSAGLLLFHRQKALEDEDLRTCAGEVGLDLGRFERDRKGDDVSARIARDVAGAEATRVVRGTSTLFIDGVLYEGGYEPSAILEALAR
jgi:predicted DsbA family dithiol-disulfide isomerase